MNCDEAKQLLADYWSKSLDEAKELSMEAHLESCAACKTEAERLGALWRGLALIPAEEPSAAVRSRFYETLAAYRHGMEAAASSKGNWSLSAWWMAVWPKQPAWQMAASFAVLVIGLGIGYAVRPGAPQQPKTDGSEIAHMREEVNSMRQLVALSLMQQQSASERMRGVSWAYRVPSSDTEVLSALLDSVNHDENVNVRLAAVDALHAFGSSPVTRTAIAQAIPKQASPVVQIALIDLAVDLKEAEAAAELRQLAADGSADPSVRDHAKWALGKMQDGSMR